MADTDTYALTVLSTKQKAKLFQDTPRQYIKQKPGRGGKSLAYVETGYVVKVLTETFNHMWDFDVVEQQVGNTHIWVKGKLTIYGRNADGTPIPLSKTQFGGAEIKRSRESDAIIDIADDLKAAASDALKKCASMFGVAADVYFPTIDQDDGDDTVQVKQAEAVFTPPKTTAKGGVAEVACTECHDASPTRMSEAVVTYSMKNFGKPLCLQCQGKVRGS